MQSEGKPLHDGKRMRLKSCTLHFLLGLLSWKGLEFLGQSARKSHSPFLYINWFVRKFSFSVFCTSSGRRTSKRWVDTIGSEGIAADYNSKDYSTQLLAIGLIFLHDCSQQLCTTQNYCSGPRKWETLYCS